MSARGDLKDVEEKKDAAEWGLFPRILHGFPASSRGGPRLPSESTHPAAPDCGPEVDEIIARLGLCRGTARTSTCTLVLKPRNDRPLEVSDSLGCFQ